MAKGKDGNLDYSMIIKVDGVTREGAEQIVESAKQAARKQEGARGTFIVTPTENLRTAGGQRVIEEKSRKLLSSPKSIGTSGQCKQITADGHRCTNSALEGNYGFCGRHRAYKR